MATKTEEQYARHAAAVRRHAERHPDRVREQRARATRAYRATPEGHAKMLARKAVYDAIQHGRLVRPDSCSACGVSCKPEASHDDYSRPLVVEWLCKRCHCRKDRRAV